MKPLKYSLWIICGIVSLYIITLVLSPYIQNRELRLNYEKIVVGDSKEKVLELIGAPKGYKKYSDGEIVWKYSLENNLIYSLQLRIKFTYNTVDTVYILED